MRISKTKAVQLVEGENPVLVLIDESADPPEFVGRTETVLSPEEVHRFAHAIMYFSPFLRKESE